jgi:phosphoribosylglycinamide formyltransferase-1
MAERFIDAAIQPDVSTIDASSLSAGQPALPMRFQWGAETIQITRMLRTWRETGPCHHGSGEQYVRKHWFEVLTDSGLTMKIYFDRQPRSGRKGPRWWLFSIRTAQQPDV